jgi:glycerol-3-phosphate acyltransferase PlsY
MRPRSAVSSWLQLGSALLVGSIPFSQLVAGSAAGADLRGIGTGTVSATNVYRAAGAGPFIAACLLDFGKGALIAALARRRHPKLLAAAVGLVVVGHNWSPFLRGAGGRGVLPALGALTVAAPPGAALIVTGIVAGHLAGDTAPACFAAQALLVPTLAGVSGRRGALLGAAVAVPMLVKRAMGNRGRAASWRALGIRLVYDRDSL